VTAVIDYGVGNLFSLTSSIRELGAECVVTSDANAIRSAERVILPGVGAFGDAMDRLRAQGLADVVIELGTGGVPLLGICLGMQLLFERSYEFGVHDGLGLLPGEVVSIERELTGRDLHLKTPQMGWNALDIRLPDCPLFQEIQPGDYVYYVHSYCAMTAPEYVAAVSEYGIEITGAVQRGRVFGTQFHPEKSGNVGLSILGAFLRIGRDRP